MSKQTCLYVESQGPQVTCVHGAARQGKTRYLIIYAKRMLQQNKTVVWLNATDEVYSERFNELIDLGLDVKAIYNIKWLEYILESYKNHDVIILDDITQVITFPRFLASDTVKQFSSDIPENQQRYYSLQTMSKPNVKKPKDLY